MHYASLQEAAASLQLMLATRPCARLPGALPPAAPLGGTFCLWDNVACLPLCSLLERWSVRASRCSYPSEPASSHLGCICTRRASLDCLHAPSLDQQATAACLRPLWHGPRSKALCLFATRGATCLLEAGDLFARANPGVDRPLTTHPLAPAPATDAVRGPCHAACLDKVIRV
ncbi:MAG: hypothetical protein J3K34DRAFT_426678 [Monoraphidium minutum]|nr:MAG: hypothetical protein J3K34DRAFT_426678 [Monoraphidium minutum]